MRNDNAVRSILDEGGVRICWWTHLQWTRWSSAAQLSSRGSMRIRSSVVILSNTLFVFVVGIQCVCSVLLRCVRKRKWRALPCFFGWPAGRNSLSKTTLLLFYLASSRHYVRAKNTGRRLRNSRPCFFSLRPWDFVVGLLGAGFGADHRKDKTRWNKQQTKQNQTKAKEY